MSTETPETVPNPPPSGHQAAPAPPPADAAPPKKKGLHPLAWVGIGCGCLLIVGAVLFFTLVGWGVRKAGQVAEEIEKDPVAFAARGIALANPEIDLVEADKDKQIVVFRSTETGETFKIDYADIESGNVTFESDEGSATFSAQADEEEGATFSMTTDEGTTTLRGGAAAAEDIPGWVLTYPDATVGAATVQTAADGGSGGWAIFTTGDGIDEVEAYYRRELDDAGFKIIGESRASSGGQQIRQLQAQQDDPARSLNVALTVNDEGDTQLTLTFSG